MRFCGGLCRFPLFSKLRKEKTVPAALITACAAFVLYLLAVQMWVVPVQALDGKAGRVTGVISEAPYERYGRFYYELETSKIELPDVPQKSKYSCHRQTPSTRTFTTR